MTLRLNGSTSGYTEIDAPAVAGSNTLLLPTGAGPLAAWPRCGCQCVVQQPAELRLQEGARLWGDVGMPENVAGRKGVRRGTGRRAGPGSRAFARPEEQTHCEHLDHVTTAAQGLQLRLLTCRSSAQGPSSCSAQLSPTASTCCAADSAHASSSLSGTACGATRSHRGSAGVGGASSSAEASTSRRRDAAGLPRRPPAAAAAGGLSNPGPYNLLHCMSRRQTSGGRRRARCSARTLLAKLRARCIILWQSQ